MASPPVPHERVAALTGAAVAPRPDAPDPEAPDRDAPDPEFWGAEPRPVRRTHRAVSVDPTGPPAWWTSLVDRTRDARLEVGIGVVVVVLVAAVAGLVWYRMGLADGDAPPRQPSATGRSERTSDAPSRADSVATPSASAASGAPAAAGAGASAGRGPTVVVHVAGAVNQPGVLLMPAGARVIDAVEGAGGANPDADLDRLNLAAKLVDGQRVLVVKIGATPIADAPVGSGAPADSGALIDLNTATGTQLETLPGIGPALAGAIIAERDRRGGFRSINELREVRGIGEARFADLRERVTV